MSLSSISCRRPWRALWSSAGAGKSPGLSIRRPRRTLQLPQTAAVSLTAPSYHRKPQ
jgi:hypothetical protein